jgi:hypothetical protein
MAIGNSTLRHTRTLADASPARARESRHDGLCISESGLGSCWCLKSCCWLATGYVSSHKPALGNPRGRCICRDCDCHKGSGLFLVTGSALPVLPAYMAPRFSG